MNATCATSSGTAQPLPPHVFMACYGGGHVAMLLPVAKVLRQRGWRISMLGLTTAATKIHEAGLPCLQFADLWEHAAPGARDFGRELCSIVASDGPVSPEETLAYHGINFADLVAQHGEANARALYAKHGRQAFCPEEFMQRVLEALRPELVITTNSPRTEMAAIRSAGRLGIPAICAVDMFALQEVEWIGKSGFADRICVLNASVRNMMIGYGRRPDEVIITGNPAFDTLLDPATVSAGAALRAARGWGDGKVTILWASQVEPERHPFSGELGDPGLPRQIEARLRDLVARDDRLRLVVRYHPSERVAFAPGPRVESSPVGEPLHALLHAVDMVVVTASTVGLEASIAGKPVISVDASIFTADAPFSRMGLSTGVTSVDDLEKPVLEIAGQLRPIPLSDRAATARQGCSATDNLVQVIDEILFRSAE